MSDVEQLDQLTESIRNDPMNWDLYLARGKIWFDFRCYDECISDLFFYESNGGSDPSYMKCIGMALDKTSSKRSLEYLERYVKVCDNDMESIVYLADTYFDNGEYQLSASAYQSAVNCGYNPGILREKASFLAGQKMYDEAAFFDPAFGKKKSLFRR